MESFSGILFTFESNLSYKQYFHHLEKNGEHLITVVFVPFNKCFFFRLYGNNKQGNSRYYHYFKTKCSIWVNAKQQFSFSTVLTSPLWRNRWENILLFWRTCTSISTRTRTCTSTSTRTRTGTHLKAWQYFKVLAHECQFCNNKIVECWVMAKRKTQELEPASFH